jgi:fido (protein-threonine AMPylation protein)
VSFTSRCFRAFVFHAGQCRAQAFGAEYLQFGPNRSSHRNDVSQELSRVFSEASRSIRSCEEQADDSNYERAAFYVAVWLHARVVQIHPFEDGNGRTSRLLLNVVLIRLGLPPLLAEFPKQEYNAVLNEFFRTGRLDAVVDLLLPYCVTVRVPHGH